VGSSIIRSPLAELAAPLRTYADAIGLGNGKPVTVERIIPHILERVIRTDRALMRMRRHVVYTTERSAQSAVVEPGWSFEECAPETSRATLRNRPTNPGGGSMSCFRAITA
jgi:hypothetical protein